MSKYLWIKFDAKISAIIDCPELYIEKPSIQLQEFLPGYIIKQQQAK